MSGVAAGHNDVTAVPWSLDPPTSIVSPVRISQMLFAESTVANTARDEIIEIEGVRVIFGVMM